MGEWKKPQLFQHLPEVNLTGDKEMGTRLMLVVALAFCLTPDRAFARMMVDMGSGLWCEATTYGVGGEYYGTWYDNCVYIGGSGGSGGTGATPPLGGDGGSNFVSFQSLAKSPISEKLQCALEKYTAATARPRSPVLKADGYAYRVNGKVKYTTNWSDPSHFGAGTTVVGGETMPSNTSYIYLAGYHLPLSTLVVDLRLPLIEVGPPGPDPQRLSLSTLDDFELSLFTGAHEVAHQNGTGGSASQEQEANWYGFKAVLNYRQDNDGAACNK